jgi:hypothetical protein
LFVSAKVGTFLTAMYPIVEEVTVCLPPTGFRLMKVEVQ